MDTLAGAVDAESETRVNFLGGHQAPPDLQGAKVLSLGHEHLAFLERLAPAQLAAGPVGYHRRRAAEKPHKKPLWAAYIRQNDRGYPGHRNMPAK